MEESTDSSHEKNIMAWYKGTSCVLGGLGIPERMGLNPGHDLSGDWASNRGNGFQMDGLSDKSPLGGLL